MRLPGLESIGWAPTRLPGLESIGWAAAAGHNPGPRGRDARPGPDVALR